MTTTKTLTPNEMDFVKSLVNSGINPKDALKLVGVNLYAMDRTENTTNKSAKPVSNNKADSKAVKPIKANKKDQTVKGKKSKEKNGKDSKKTDLAFGKNIKVGSFVKIYNLKTKQVVMAGKVKDLDKSCNAVELTNTRKYAIENCVAISEKEFAKVSKKVKAVAKANDKKISTSTRLAPQDYKLCYAKYLVSLGKITEADFNQAKDDKTALHNLYELFAKSDEPVKLSNDEAIKIFADNSAKVNA